MSCCHSAWLPLVCAKEERTRTCKPIFSSYFPAWLELTSISPVCLFEPKPPAVWLQFLNQLNNYVVTVHHTSASHIIIDIFISNKWLYTGSCFCCPLCLPVCHTISLSWFFIAWSLFSSTWLSLSITGWHTARYRLTYCRFNLGVGR